VKDQLAAAGYPVREALTSVRTNGANR
jgi:hypothetical protein